ncbi:MAG: SRPBCC domain-containing protein [Flavobacteriales bacterium]|nr:SRPBCC domain-containing protein [Flavobacteriales bacterium]
MKIKTANIFQVFDVNARPADVYDLLMTSEKHGAFTQKSAEINPIEGGSFAFCNRNHTGYFLKLVKNKQMVLAWTHRKFPRGHFSIVDITLERNENGTTCVTLNHIGVPETCDGWLTEAWRKTYWEPMQTYVAAPAKEALEMA